MRSSWNFAQGAVKRSGTIVHWLKTRYLLNFLEHAQALGNPHCFSQGFLVSIGRYLENLNLAVSNVSRNLEQGNQSTFDRNIEWLLGVWTN